LYCFYVYVYSHKLKTITMNNEIKYTTRHIYVPADKIDTLVKFQEKCRNNGHKSYSSVIIKLIEQYNKNN